MEEVGDKLETVVRGNVPRYSVLGEDMDDKELGEFGGGDGIMGGDKYCLLGKTVNNNQDGVIASRAGEFFDEVHGDRIPWTFWDWKLLE